MSIRLASCCIKSLGQAQLITIFKLDIQEICKFLQIGTYEDETSLLEARQLANVDPDALRELK